MDKIGIACREQTKTSKEAIDMSVDLATLPATPSSQGFPRNEDGLVFHEPWEAQAFALARSLQERGVFSATEWAAALGAEIKQAQAAGDADTGETYYHHWLAALERLVAAKGLADTRTLARNREAWRRAYARTPHGTPIVPLAADFGD
jgi:nitrile hydratase accessory protein